MQAADGNLQIRVSEIAKLVAFLVFLTLMVLAARRNYQVHLQEQQSRPSYLDLIENIESDID